MSFLFKKLYSVLFTIQNNKWVTNKNFKKCVYFAYLISNILLLTLSGCIPHHYISLPVSTAANEQVLYFETFHFGHTTMDHPQWLT